MSARLKSQDDTTLATMTTTMTIPTVPATALQNVRGGHDRDRHFAGRLCP